MQQKSMLDKNIDRSLITNLPWQDEEMTTVFL